LTGEPVTTAVYAALIVGFFTALAASAARAWWYARHPMHLRWELYPVPHEAPDRARYGGSYFETAEWWSAPRRSNRLGALVFMTREILFLHALHTSNRRLWYRSFPFHAGLYLMLAGGAALLGAGLASVVSGGPPPEGVWAGLLRVCAAFGWAGVLLSITGAGALLLHRLTDRTMKGATSPGDLFNLACFILAPGLLAFGAWRSPAGSPDLLAVVTGLLTWNSAQQMPVALGAGLVSCAALAAYIPMTHMSHFIGKYFTYHAVRWDDRPLADYASVASTIATNLTLRPTWSAGHVGADGKRSWADVAASNPNVKPTP
jgi:nitrate reductase gamma subunit